MSNYERVQRLLEQNKISARNLVEDSESLLANTITLNNSLSKRSGDKLIFSNSSSKSRVKSQRQDIKGEETSEQLLKSFSLGKQHDIVKAFNHWVSLKLPKPIKDTTKIRAYVAIATMLKSTDPAKLLEIFTLYAEVIHSPNGKFSKKKPFRLPLWEFLKWDFHEATIARTIPYLQKDDSMFDAFLHRSSEQIYEDFYYTAKDTNPEISRAVLKAWRKHGSRPPTKTDLISCRKISVRFVQFWKEHKMRLLLNGLPTLKRKKPEAVAEYLLNEFLPTRPDFKLYYFNSDTFFHSTLIDFLNDRRMLISAGDAQFIKKQHKLKRRKKSKSRTGKAFTPSWQNK